MFFSRQKVLGTLFSGRTATLIPRKTFTELVAGIQGLCIVTESKFGEAITTESNKTQSILNDDATIYSPVCFLHMRKDFKSSHTLSYIEDVGEHD